MQRRIFLLLAVAALMTLTVAAPASAQTINFSPNVSPTVSPTLDTSDTIGDINANDSADDNAIANDSLDDFANDNTVQCVGDPLVDLGPDSPSPIGGDDEGDQCADDGGTNEDNDSTDFPTLPTFP